MEARGEKVFSVSEITELIKTLLEDGLPRVTVEGELSNFKSASSGHWYFNLKDRETMLQAVMFRGKAGRIGFVPADGMLVRATGAITVYPARGQYQLLVEGLEQAGVGDLLALLEERKRRLAAQGLFDEARKRALPRFPTRIAVITSPTGAAIRDVITILERRNAGITVTILPSAVQGEAAPRELIRQLGVANRYRLGDVIILGRGGGSLEDLLAFSDEDLVRAVAASELPVISAVGHEIDWALTDFAADLRAATPSAAAELVSESRQTMRAELSQRCGELETAIRARIDRALSILARFEPASIEGRFMRLFHPSLRRFDEARDFIVGEGKRRLLETRHRLSLAEGLLAASSPDAILARGYSIVRRRLERTIIRAASSLAAGQDIEIQFAKGSATARVEELTE